MNKKIYFSQFLLLFFLWFTCCGTVVLADEFCFNDEVGDSCHSELKICLEKINKVFNISYIQHYNTAQKKQLCIEALLKAVRQRSWSKIYQVREYLRPLRDNEGLSLFAICVKNGMLYAIQDIISHRLTHYWLCGDTVENSCLLHLAIEMGHDHLLPTLVEELGVPINQSCLINFHGVELNCTPLAYSVMLGEIKCCDYVINHSGNSQFSIDGFTNQNLLYLAISHGQNEMLEYLLNQHFDKMKDFIESQNGFPTPLMLAAKLGNLKAVFSLFRFGANLDAQDYDGKTAMHYAVINKQKDTINLLWSFGAEMMMNDHYGRGPIDYLDGEDFSTKTINTLLMNLIKMNRHSIKKPFYFRNRNFHNLVIQGGGETHTLGVIELLEEKEVVNNIKRVGGSAASSVMATLLAFDYNAREIREVLFQNPLEEILDVNVDDDTLKEIKFFEQFLYQGRDNNYRNIKLQFFEHNSLEGVCDAELFRQWIEKLIQNKTNIEYCTFGDLRKLIEQGELFKHLHIFVTEVIDNTLNNIHLSSENEEWDDIIISDAVATSISIPVVFKHSALYYKSFNGQRSQRLENTKFFAGIPSENCLIEMFDQREEILNDGEIGEGFPVFNGKTLGLVYSSVAMSSYKKIETTKELLKKLIDFYLITQNNLKFIKYNKNRLIKINYETSIFERNAIELNNLILAAKRSGETFFNDQEKKHLCFFIPTSKDSKAIGLSEYPHPHLIRRDEYLSIIEKNLNPSSFDEKQQRSKFFALYGISGIGKSELAIYFANQNIRSFSLIYIIPSTTEEMINAAYRNLAKLLLLPIHDEEPPDAIRKKVFSSLENNFSKKPWLLVYDDIQDVQRDIDFPRKGGCVLITAKEMDSLLHQHESIVVEPFLLEESVSLILEITKQKSDSDKIAATDLAQELGNFPLAVEVAAQYISKANMSIEEYLEKLEYNDLFTFNENIRYGKSLKTALTDVLENVKNNNKLAYDWLKLCSYFNFEHIPEKWVESWLKQNNYLLVSRLKEDVIAALIKYGAIDYHYKNKSFSINKFLQIFIQKNEEQLYNSCQLTIDFLNEESKKLDENNAKTWGKAKIWAIHGERLVNLANNVDNQSLSQVLSTLGSIHYFIIEDYEKALSYHTQALIIREEAAQQINFHDTAKSMNNVGCCLEELGQYEQALDLQMQALRMFEDVLEENHLDIAIALSNVGDCLSKLGRNDEALRVQYRAIEISKKNCTENCNHYLASLPWNNLGAALGNNGKFEDALYYNQQALEISKSETTPESNSLSFILASYFYNVGIALTNLERYYEAKEHFEMAWKMYREIYGEKKHPKKTLVEENIRALEDIIKQNIPVSIITAG